MHIFNELKDIKSLLSILQSEKKKKKRTSHSFNIEVASSSKFPPRPQKTRKPAQTQDMIKKKNTKHNKNGGFLNTHLLQDATSGGATSLSSTKSKGFRALGRRRSGPMKVTCPRKPKASFSETQQNGEVFEDHSKI